MLLIYMHVMLGLLLIYMHVMLGLLLIFWCVMLGLLLVFWCVILGLLLIYRRVKLFDLHSVFLFVLAAFRFTCRDFNSVIVANVL
uniref:Uncharacterized protein n=1 Tax=Anguilla anguilla TaxID=7936 RepID=A0A0E9XPJ5_ANGAN